MRKFLLVVLIGMVLAMSLYGFVIEFMSNNVEEIDHIEETTIAVYVE